MNKIIRKAICLICFVALALTCVAAQAAEAPQVNATVNLITYADSSQDILDITVYPAETDKWVAITIVDGVDNPVEIYQGKAAPVIEADFSLVDISAGDSITLRIALSPSKAVKDYTQVYYTYAQQQQAIRDIMDPAKTITQEIADKISLKLDGDFNLLNANGILFLKSQLSSVYGEMTDIPVAEFVRSLSDNIKLGVLSCKDETIIKSFMEREYVSLGLSTLEEYKWYTSISNEERIPLIVSALATKTYGTLADFIDSFKAENFLYKMSLQHASKVMNFIKTNAGNQADGGEALVLDFAAYDDGLNFVQREYFDSQIATIRYESLAKFKEDFDLKLLEASEYVEDSEADETPLVPSTPSVPGAPTVSGGNYGNGSVIGTVGGNFTGGGAGGAVTPVVPVIPEAPKGSFKDITSVPWAQEAIEALAKDGVINGVGDDNFDPEGIVTREQYVKIMVGAFGLEAKGDIPAFGDVAEGQWYSEFIKIAVTNGLINGVSESEFGIGENISRQDMAVIIYRTAKALGMELKVKTTDVPSDIDSTADYAKEAVTALYQAGIINGVGGGNFAPADFATRAQAAKIVYELRRMS